MTRLLTVLAIAGAVSCAALAWLIWAELEDHPPLSNVERRVARLQRD